MSRTKPSEIQELAIRLPCPYCKAEPGEWCTTVTGRWAEYLHGDRDTPFYSVYSLGYQAAEDGLLCTVLDARNNTDQWTRNWLERRLSEHRCQRHQGGAA